jgi:hypothetical protein
MNLSIEWASVLRDHCENLHWQGNDIANSM